MSVKLIKVLNLSNLFELDFDDGGGFPGFSVAKLFCIRDDEVLDIHIHIYRH